MTTKRLTKALINGHNSLNSAKYFAGDESKNYSVFQPLLGVLQRLAILTES